MKTPEPDLAKPSFWQSAKQSKWSSLSRRTAAPPELGLAQGYLFPTPTTSCKVVPSSGQRSAELGEQFDRLLFELRLAFVHRVWPR